MQALNYSTWFMPTVTVVQPSTSPGIYPAPDSVIKYGDMLHVDFGVTALGLNTDTQHLGYVLHPGESEADIPKGFKDGLKKANLLQDIVRAAMRPGRSGNEALVSSLGTAKNDGIDGRVYCHPIGDWGHSAGSLVGKHHMSVPERSESNYNLLPLPGMTNLQDSVPVLGDLPILSDTYYSIELNAEHFVPERNASFSFMQEEDVYWNANTEMWEFVWARQEKFHVVKSSGIAAGRAGQRVMRGST